MVVRLIQETEPPPKFFRGRKAQFNLQDELSDVPNPTTNAHIDNHRCFALHGQHGEQELAHYAETFEAGNGSSSSNGRTPMEQLPTTSREDSAAMNRRRTSDLCLPRSSAQ